jgi:hypothetical protein
MGLASEKLGASMHSGPYPKNGGSRHSVSLPIFTACDMKECTDVSAGKTFDFQFVK